MRWILLGIEVCVFASFTWALVGWFVKRNEVKRWELNYIRYAALFFTICHLLAVAFYPVSSATFYIAGASLLLISFYFFWWTVYHFRKQPPTIAFAEEIVTPLKTSGPYSIVRHPFYTSYTLAWVGGTVATGCWWLGLSVACMFFIYYRAAKMEEAQWLAGKDAEAYRQYMQQTGMFFPKIL